MVEHRRVPSRKSNKSSTSLARHEHGHTQIHLLAEIHNGGSKQWEDHEHHGDYEVTLGIEARSCWRKGEGRLTTLGNRNVTYSYSDIGKRRRRRGEGFEWGPKTSLASTGSLSVGKEGLYIGELIKQEGINSPMGVSISSHKGILGGIDLIGDNIDYDRMTDCPMGTTSFCDKQLINTGSKDLHDKTYQAVNPKEWQKAATDWGEKVVVKNGKRLEEESLNIQFQLKWVEAKAEGRGKGKLKKRRYGE
ncbi:hypothetical protein BY996DRAFT_6503893, partial [Phakopsora pachyrhizi]